MQVALQSQVLIRFDSAFARRLTMLLLALFRSTLVAVYIFYAKFHPLEALFGMRYESGWFLFGLGGLLGIPLHALFQLFPGLRSFASHGLSFPHAVGLPAWRFLVIAVPLYLLLCFAWRPMRRAALRLLAIDAPGGADLPSRFFRTNAPFFVRAVLCCAVLFVVVRYGFTPQFYAVGDAHNYLLMQHGVARLFLYLSLAPGLPLQWLLGRGVPIAPASLYPTFGLLLGNSLLIGLFATAARLLRLSAATAFRSQPKEP